MAWTGLSSAFGYGTKLTSTQQGQLRDNVTYCYDFIASGDLTDHGILLGSGTGAITPTAVMSNGQVLIGQTGADPLPKTISGHGTLSAGGVLTITGLPNNIVTQAKMDDNSIGRGELKDGEEEQSMAKSSNGMLTFSNPGAWGFLPQVKHNHASVGDNDMQLDWLRNGDTMGVGNTYYSYLHATNSSSTYTFYVKITYMTASGEYGWLFFLKDKTTGGIIRGWFSSDHPSMNDEARVHPFIDIYDPAKHEIHCVVLEGEEYRELEVEAAKANSSILQLAEEKYDHGDGNITPWPTEPITLGLPKTIFVDDGKGGQKEIVPSYRTLPAGTKVQSIKKVVHKPDYIILKSLKKKG